MSKCIPFCWFKSQVNGTDVGICIFLYTFLITNVLKHLVDYLLRSRREEIKKFCDLAVTPFLISDTCRLLLRGFPHP